jgi:twitching motility protein PilJ
MTTDFRPSSNPPKNNSYYRNGVPITGPNGTGSLNDGQGTSPSPSYPRSTRPVETDRNFPYGLEVESHVAITQPTRSGLMQRFHNLSVGRKQLAGLFTSNLLTIVGLVGVGTFVIITGGRSQLLNQARSELSVMDMAYHLKIDQMGLGLRGQSDNPAIINIAIADAAGDPITAADRAAVQQILQNEVAAHAIEYATLVGRDLNIIASANANRIGQKFDPNGLVGTVLANPRQIQTNAIVPWTELQTEQPPLPDGVEGQDALIRYTLTPVTAANSDEVVGVLVSGDIVNGKADIPRDTLAAFESGYSAVYQEQADGSFALASSLQAADNKDLDAAAANLPLADPALLAAAVATPEQTVTRRDVVGDTPYTLAAKAVTDFNNEPVGVLVRGVSEAPLNQLIRHTLKLQLAIALLMLVIDVLLARLLGRSILRPLQNLREAAWKFGQGDRTARADIYATDEVGRVAQIFNQLTDNIAQSETLLRNQAELDKDVAERSQILVELSSELRQTLDENDILNTSVERLRAALRVDRVLIYRFNEDLKSGIITAESVAPGWNSTRGQLVEDPLTPEAVEHFFSGRVSYIEDRDQAGLTHCHCDILERLQVKANIVAPIIVGNQLIGLLCAHQCSGPRQWTPSELDVMQQLSNQLGYALNQSALLNQQERSLLWERQLNEAVSRMRESLDESQIFQIAVTETRKMLAGDRSVIYLFDESWQGTFVAESVGRGWVAALNSQVYDPCFADGFVKRYQQGRVQATPDIYNAGLTECHIQQLETYQVKANLVAPIVVSSQLIGLLIVHQCSGPRQWEETEIDFLRKVAIQLGFAIEHARLFSQTESLSEERLQRQETLQQQLVALLSDVEGVSSGDLTVRANVTAGEIGTVADFFNAIVESLQQIVTKVKQSAEQVNASISENETSIRSLADEALRQANEVTLTLNSVQEMTASIQQVADSARQAAAVASNASATAESSGQAMDLTVQNILNLRDIIGETSKKVKRLGESSQQISKVVSLINQIAMQTNLLAINAGIEAARAGEEGQGFAVVAEEVGELAARSADATQEIERIVETIQRETVEVVEAMEQSTTEVVAGTHLVEEAKQNLGRILEVSRQIDQLVQSISETTVSQVEVSATVTKLMQDIAQVSERTSSSSVEITDSLQRTVAVAQALQASVGTFKTGQ